MQVKYFHNTHESFRVILLDVLIFEVLNDAESALVGRITWLVIWTSVEQGIKFDAESGLDSWVLERDLDLCLTVKIFVIEVCALVNLE